MPLVVSAAFTDADATLLLEALANDGDGPGGSQEGARNAEEGGGGSHWEDQQENLPERSNHWLGRGPDMRASIL